MEASVGSAGVGIMSCVVVVGASSAWVVDRSSWESWGNEISHVIRLVVAAVAAGWSGVPVLVEAGAGLARFVRSFSRAAVVP